MPKARGVEHMHARVPGLYAEQALTVGRKNHIDSLQIPPQPDVVDLLRLQGRIAVHIAQIDVERPSLGNVDDVMPNPVGGSVAPTEVFDFERRQLANSLGRFESRPSHSE